jgi:transposase
MSSTCGPFQRLPGSRRSVFEALDRPAMQELPANPYVYAEWKERRVAFDYHIDVEGHYYSVPHGLVGYTVWARFTAATVEVFFRSQRVATHARSYQRGGHTTLPEHMPKSHRAHAEWSPKRLIQWGESIGINTGAIVEHLLRSKPHPEQGYRACLGLLALAREYGERRLESASALALRLASPTRKSVLSILKSGRDLQPATTEPLALELPAHGNVRGPGYYH